MGLLYWAVNMDIKIAKISTFYKYFRVHLLTAVNLTKQYS